VMIDYASGTSGLNLNLTLSFVPARQLYRETGETIPHSVMFGVAWTRMRLLCRRSGLPNLRYPDRRTCFAAWPFFYARCSWMCGVPS